LNQQNLQNDGDMLKQIMLPLKQNWSFVIYFF